MNACIRDVKEYYDDIDTQDQYIANMNNFFAIIELVQQYRNSPDPQVKFDYTGGFFLFISLLGLLIDLTVLTLSILKIQHLFYLMVLHLVVALSLVVGYNGQQIHDAHKVLHLPIQLQLILLSMKMVLI